jgi:hypothetical protein
MRTRLVLVACIVLVAGPPGTPATAAAGPADDNRGPADLASVVPVAGDALSDALDDGDVTEARYALERARSLFTPGLVRRRFGDVALPGPRRATLVLRDLAVRVEHLSPAARQEAEGLLARPTDGSADLLGNGYRVSSSRRTCSTRLCVHWVDRTGDAPPPADPDGDGLPDWVQVTAAELERVWRAEVGSYGYRAPRSDLSSDNNGGDARLDVYLADIGADGLYGYCTTDDPELLSRWDVSAYCVLDDDFARDQFGASPLDSLRVTAAHELFHAVQFGYDLGEDPWLMESTAAWIEDEVHDDVDDNRRYLDDSPLSHPHRPLDSGLYGPWVFFRFMAEYFGNPARDRPDVVRQVWERADAAAGAPNLYSLQAVAAASAANGTPFRSVFADFGWTGPFARDWYDEGASYPQAPMTTSLTLTAASPGTGARSVVVQHLASRHVALRPGANLPTRHRRVRVDVDLPAHHRGSEATVTVHRRRGGLRPFAVALDAAGDGSITVDFLRRRVVRVVLTLSNTSTRMACARGTWLACGGVPHDDGLRFAYSARAVRHAPPAGPPRHRRLRTVPRGEPGS